MVAFRPVHAVACAVALGATGQIEAISVGESACSQQQQDRDRRSMLVAKMAVFDVKCEQMCKAIEAYPNCECPGFQGNPPSAGDTRKCIDQYCADPANPCPNDGFVTCVSETTQVSLLQWGSLLQSFDTSLSMYSNMVKKKKAMKVDVDMESCTNKEHNRNALLQAKAVLYDVKCEEMCKAIGAYPKCDCPGFAGNPPSADDTRACVDKYCHDLKTPCPNDGFVTCVSETTKVSALQWDSVFHRLSSSLDLYKTTLLAAKKAPAKHA